MWASDGFDSELYMNHQESSINSHDMIISAYVHGKRAKRAPTY